MIATVTARHARFGALALALVILVTAWASRHAEGRRALDAANAALARGEHAEAIVSARSAAEARCPFCEAPRRAFERLKKIAADAERRGDGATALASWRAVRAATLAQVWLRSRSPERSEAETEIARLEHQLETLSKGGAVTEAVGEARLKATLEKSSGTSSTVYVLLTGGGLLFALGASRFLRSRAVPLFDLLLAIAGGGLAGAALLFF